MFKLVIMETLVVFAAIVGVVHFIPIKTYNVPPKAGVSCLAPHLVVSGSTTEAFPPVVYRFNLLQGQAAAYKQAVMPTSAQATSAACAGVTIKLYLIP
jgi:hypothetical protein